MPQPAATISYLPTQSRIPRDRGHETIVAERARSLLARHRRHRDSYQVRFCGMDLTILTDVFCPEYGEGTQLLAGCLSVNEKDHVLDMGTGSGALGLLAASKGAKVVATDISARASECARRNTEALGLTSLMDVRSGDLFERIRPDERFSLILFNLPFMEGQPNGLLELAMFDYEWRTMKGFFRDLHRHLKVDGRAFLAFSNCGDVDLLTKLCSDHGFCARQLSRMELALEFFVLEVTRAG